MLTPSSISSSTPTSDDATPPDASIDLHIDGLVTGDVSTDGCVCVAPEATVYGTISARIIQVAGTVEGTLRAAEKLILLPAANIRATLQARFLEIHPGAQFDGTLQTDNGAPLQDDRPAQTSRPSLAPVPPGQTPEDLSPLDATPPLLRASSKRGRSALNGARLPSNGDRAAQS